MKRLSENEVNDRKKRKYTCEGNTPKLYEEGELGIIEQITVQNFMCHENLTLKFEPHMNFIIGQNGSGKSAILTAIILALGGKSSSTDRFTSIKGFIKSGKNKAKVEIVLRNQGPLAYKPQVYGEKIIVIREFTKEGVSSYKIKSESGTICSNTKRDLTSIMEAMDIMVECPVCVLTQATSKRFLISKDAKADRLFEFFYKGTGLEKLEESYKMMSDMSADSEAELEKKREIIPELKKELKKWQKFLDSKDKIFEFKNEKIWAAVIRMEKEVQAKEEECKKIEKELEEHKKTLEGCKKSLNETKTKLDELNKKKSDILIEMDTFRERLKKLNGDYEEHSSSYRRHKGTLQKLENDQKKLEEDILCLENCINDQKRKDETDMAEENRKREEAVQELKNKNIYINEKYKTYTGTINTIRNEQSNFERVIKDKSDELNQHRYELRNIEDNLTATRNAIKNKVNAFGEFTEQVLKEITMEKRFRKKPVGPIGMYLEVKDPRWAAAVEFATNSYLLNSFCVDNHQDSALLRNILIKYYRRPPSIIVSQYENQMFDIRDGKLQSNFPTVLDMLVIKHYIVANCLIDQAQIERKILVEDERMMVSLMNNPPRNCASASAFFMNCDRIDFNPSRLYSYGKRKPRSRLSAIRAEDVRNMEKDREEKITKINEIRQQIQKMKSSAESLPAKIESLERDMLKISIEHKRNAMEIKELECRVEAKNMDCLQEELQSFCNSYKQKKEEIERCLQIVSELESKRHELQGKKENASSTLESLERDFNNINMKISELSKRTESFASGKRKYELELRCKENKCENHQKELEDFQNKLQSASSNAESTCPRINTDRSYEEICRLISETEKVVQEKSNCDMESLSAKYKEKQENLRRAEADHERFKAYNNKIAEMVKKRKSNLTTIRKNTELLISLTFSTILAGNGYNGHLIFDQSCRTLDMKASPRASDSSRKNHSSLSGGERSFVTIAFLLALWERTRMPFRILDEYDVFMDSSNRQLSVDLLCKKAVEISKTQFIFLSPLELARMPSLDCINILKLAPPKRKTDEDNSPRKKRS